MVAKPWRTDRTAQTGRGTRRSAARKGTVRLVSEPPDDISLTIALAEIEGIQDFLVMDNEHAATRFNYHLLLISATIAGSAAVLGSNSASALVGIVGLVAAFVLILGLLTFARIAHAEITREEFISMINLYRAYLHTRAPDLRQYNILPVQSPGVPRQWKVQSALKNLAVSTAIINAAVAAAASVMLVHSYTHLDIQREIGIGISSLVMFGAGQIIWLRRVYRHGHANMNRILGLTTAPTRS